MNVRRRHSRQPIMAVSLEGRVLAVPPRTLLAVLAGRTSFNTCAGRFRTRGKRPRAAAGHYSPSNSTASNSGCSALGSSEF
jgi:hypothetical protein